MPRGISVKLLSWNIRANCGASRHRVARIVNAIVRAKADVIALQEVFADGTSELLRDGLRAHGYVGWHFTGSSGREFRYGCAIASRFRVRAVTRNNVGAPWPHLLVRALVDTPGGPVEVVSVHMPNGSKYGWKKIEMFEALGQLLALDHDTPRVVGGDFNEPRVLLRGGAIISFGADSDGVVRGCWQGFPNARWQNAVDNVLGPRSPVRHAWLTRNPGRSQTTHVNRGVTNCFFDHLLVSRDHFVVTASGYHHQWRRGLNAISDHSAAWAIIRPG